MSFTAALVQMTARASVRANIEPVMTMIEEAAKAGAVYVQTPEMTNILQPNRPLFFEEIKPQDQDLLLKAAVAQAKHLKIWLHLGSLAIKIGENKAVNRAFFISPQGEIKAIYDKIHLFDVTLPDGTQLQESAAYQAGEKLITLETPLAHFGLSICYDLRFPSLFRTMAQRGATVQTIPSSFTVPTGEAHWHVLMRARAIETGSYVLAAAQTGSHECGRETYGHSLIIDPWGKVVAEKPSGEGIVMAEINPAKSLEMRAKIPNLRDAKPNI